MTKIIEGIRNFSYERRLKLLKLHSVERRRVKGDLIEVFEWLKGFDKRNIEKVVTLSSQDEIRSNGFKLEKFILRKKIGRIWFINRVVDGWNSLSQQVDNAQTIGSIK